MTVATFTDTMAEIVLELNEREIYNDIRSQIDTTTVETIVDEETSYGERTISELHTVTPYKTAGQYADYNLYSEPGDVQVTWLGAWCYWARGGMLDYGPYTDQVNAAIIATYSDHCTVRLTNNGPAPIMTWGVSATYSYLDRPGAVHEETGVRTYTARATDAVSIAKYGRRVMNLTWPLGQTQAQTQALVEGYLARYKDAVPQLTMELQGSTDALVIQILTRKLSDLITVENTRLGMSADFYINFVAPSHDAEGLLVAKYTLEEQRGMESGNLFTLDTSLLDGPDILGW